MRFSTIAFALAAAAVASAANVTVIVGDQNMTVFNPPSVMVNAGDTVTFEFHSKNHSVTQSTFANPCQVMTTPKAGINSGFHLTAPGTTQLASWSFTVDDPSTPLWFFCAQTVPVNHCQTGMVFAVNPTADKTFEAFQAAAKSGNAASNTTAPGTNATSGNSTSGNPTPSGFSTIVGSPTGSAASDTTSSAAAASSSNGALQLGGNAATLLTVVGLVAGLIL